MLSIYCNVDEKHTIVAKNILSLVTTLDKIDCNIKQQKDYDLYISIYKSDAKFIINIQKNAQRDIVIIETIDVLNEKFTLRKALFRALYKAIGKRPSPWGVLTGIRPIKMIDSYLKSHSNPYVFLKNQLLISQDKIDLSLKVIQNQEQANINGIHLYIGIPFCPSKCSYCSFTSYTIDKNKEMVVPYINTLVKEIKLISQTIKEHGYKISSIYIGGGTPTSLTKPHLKLLLSTLAKEFDLENIKEYTLEGGRPDTLTEDKMAMAKEYGVNRISINCQTLNPRTLRRVNRNHNAEDFEEAMVKAKSIGFKWINTDLIYGLEDESLEDFFCSLEKVIDLEPQNITIHSLAVKRAAATKDFSSHYKDEMEQGLKQAYKLLENAQYRPYYLYRQKAIAGNLENTGFAKDELYSLYNIVSIEENSTILALGCGAVSKIMTNKEFTPIQNPKDPNQYSERVEKIVKQKIELLEQS
ncbi:coproporphyrinogen dehydrogenase HemZ [Proteinivorax tanatarense]|uniref:Coproporphyrinogen dehydrogenase HemZ n=1 Tax=Proteinivorax tanatarense TaxID=1260629 RepID=A0AAU7VNQ3_9FIRM